MQITIKHVGIEQRPAKGKGQPYEMAEIIYSDERGGPKTFKLASFANPQVFAVVTAAQSGDQLNVTVVKGDDGYNKWTSATPADGSGGNPPQAGAARAPQGQTNSFQRDFETKDERAVKQRLIVRQSSLAQAVAVLSVGAKTAPTKEAVFELANAFTAYVYEAPDLFDQPNDDPESDIPY